MLLPGMAPAWITGTSAGCGTDSEILFDPGTRQCLRPGGLSASGDITQPVPWNCAVGFLSGTWLLVAEPSGAGTQPAPTSVIGGAGYADTRGAGGGTGIVQPAPINGLPYEGLLPWVRVEKCASV